MFRSKIYLFIFLLFSFSVLKCQNNDLPDENNITASDLINAMEKDSNLVILDVRTPSELTGPLGKIDNVINIPVQVLSNRISELENRKNNNIAVICRSGNRSVFATKLLIENGFKAKNVIGGMISYNKQR